MQESEDRLITLLLDQLLFVFITQIKIILRAEHIWTSGVYAKLQGLGAGKGQGLIHSKINKERSIGCRRDQEVTGDRGKERKEGRTKKRTGGDWKNR